MGASGVDSFGVGQALLNATQVYGAMICAADKSFILADSSIFGNRSLQRKMEWNADSHLICEMQPAGLLDAIEQRGVT